MLSRFRLLIAALLIASSGFVGASRVAACDTPVYRYAMYRWPAANYFVFFVHSDEPTKEQEAVNNALMALEDSEPPKPNVSFYDIPSADIEAAPQIAAAHWKKLGKPASAYIVIAPPPLGGVVYAGALSLPDVKAMTVSPARTRLASMLEEGMATVLVVLDSGGSDDSSTGSKATDNAADSKADDQPEKVVSNDVAAQITQLVVDNVRQGKLDLYAAPTGAVENESEKDLRPKHEIAMLRISRDDPAEQWLIRMLLAVEPDLHEFNQPMVFPVYGRGRVHPPYLGLGISAENLADAVQFLTGACSCTVKEENPGVDLLVDYDWESAAITLAQKFGVEEGNEQLGAVDLFPDLIIPSEPEDASSVASAPRGDDQGAGENAVDKTDAGTGVDGVASGAGDSAAGDSASGGSEPPAGQELARASSDTDAGTPAAAVTANSSIWAVGGVLVVALGLLFAATLIILRPR